MGLRRSLQPRWDTQVPARCGWKEDWQAFGTGQARIHRLRAVMGHSDEATTLAGQPDLLTVAATEAGRQLTRIEANAAWTEAWRADQNG